MARRKKQVIKAESPLQDKAGRKQLKKTGADSPMQMREYLMLVFLAVFVFLIYSNNLTGPFVFDDEQNIRDNPHIRLKKLTLEGIIKAGIKSHVPSRPVANISFALNYYFHKYNIMGYHLVNILIHITTGILLFFFIKTSLELKTEHCQMNPQGSFGNLKFLISFFTAFIWLVHPVQIQSVAYIVQRMNSMASMFYVLSFLLYAKGRLAQGNRKKTLLFSGCVFAGILALGSKQIAGTLPFFIFLYEWYFFQELSLDWFKRRFSLFAGILVLFLVFAFVYMGANPLKYIQKTYAYRDFTLDQRVLTEFRVVVFYISLLIFPHPSRLSLTHAFPLSYSLTDPVTTIISIGFVTGLTGLACYIAKKHPLISFCILWYFGNLVIESSVLGLEIIFEHRNYLPSMLVSLLVVILILRAADHSFVRQYAKPEWVGIGIMCALVMILSLFTYQRNKVWSEDVTLWEDCIKKSPKDVRPRNNLGIALSSRKKYEDAMEIFSETIKMKPDYEYGHNNLGLVLKRLGRTEEAIPCYYEALRLDPGYADAHYNLANAMVEQEDLDKAVYHFSMVIRLAPLNGNAQNALGSVLARQGQFEKATEHYYQALKISPDFAEAHNNLGLALVDMEKSEQAVKHYSEAFRIKPDYAEAHYNLGLALAKMGDFNGAAEQFSEAIKINPTYVKAHNNLGNTLAAQGKINKATEHYSRTLRIDPDFADAHYNMGVSMARQGKEDEAVAHYSKVLQIDPDYANAHYNLGSIMQRRKKFKEAISHYSEALRVNPDDAEARKNLEDCRLRD